MNLNWNPTLKCVRTAAILLPGLALAQSSTQPARTMPTHDDFVKAAQMVRKTRSSKRQPDVEATITAPIAVGDRQMPLPASALAAIRLESGWKGFEAQPSLSADGKIVYTFGQGMPNIPCALGHLTRIELQPGEKFDGEVPYSIGESGDVWKIDTHTLLIDGVTHAYLVIVPKYSGHDTNISIFTDRRAYDIRLLSSVEGYVSRVGFRYPDWEEREHERQLAMDQHAAEVAHKSDEAKESAADKLKAADAMEIAIRNTNYEHKWGRHAKRDTPWLDPVSVYDNGSLTVIQLPESARHRDLPVLKIVGPNGAADSPNFHIDNQKLTYVVDGLFSKAELFSGVGKGQRSVELVNHGVVSDGR